MMAYQDNTFAGQLKHFAKSVDIVDDDVFDRVRVLVYKYVRNELGAEYFELTREQQNDAHTELRMFWSSDDREHTWRLTADDGTYVNCVTRAVALNQPMWVVADDKSPLLEANKYEDLWSHAVEIPRYQPLVDKPIRTVVVIPLRRRRVLGAYYFESCSYIGITEVAKTELMLLADSLAILFELYEAHKSQSRMTGEAIFDLQERLESARFPRLTKPHFFVAFSNRADPRIRLVINEVLDQFTDRLESTDWTQINETGNIHNQIAREIVRSRFGICYLSEPADEPSDHKYVDNPNVVFEAGMLHALTSANAASDVSEPTGWIPMREADSPSAPFDFASERTIEVPRTASGDLNEDRLKNLLLERVAKLLGDPAQ
jgi:hypothetical protein